MNRYNVGNVTTNAVQIGSVGNTTLAALIRRREKDKKQLGHAEQTLTNGNNTSYSSKENNTKDTFVESDNNVDYGWRYNANQIEESTEKDNDRFVYMNISPQSEYIGQRINSDFNWYLNYTNTKGW